MYSLLVKTHFDAAHFLKDYPGECANLHGHTWKIEVVVEGEELNEIDILYDFKDLKKATNQVIKRFDHKYINEIKPFDKKSPTGENLSRYIYDELEKILPENISLKEIRVWESDSACLTYNK